MSAVKRATEALHRLESTRRGWDEAELNDFSIVENTLSTIEQALTGAKEALETLMWETADPGALEAGKSALPAVVAALEGERE